MSVNISIYFYLLGYYNKMEKEITTIATPTIKRLPSYLRLIRELDLKGEKSVSTTYISEKLDIEPILVRKDISATGVIGKPRVGFNIQETITKIENILGWNNSTDAFLVGTGNLGTALLGYKGFSKNGLNIVAAFDNDLTKIGRKIHGVKTFNIEKLPNLTKRMHVQIAILCTPDNVTQDIVDKMTKAGIKAIWNFSPTQLKTNDDVIVQNEDLSSGLALLSSKMKAFEKE